MPDAGPPTCCIDYFETPLAIVLFDRPDWSSRAGSGPFKWALRQHGVAAVNFTEVADQVTKVLALREVGVEGGLPLPVQISRDLRGAGKSSSPEDPPYLLLSPGVPLQARWHELQTGPGAANYVNGGAEQPESDRSYRRRFHPGSTALVARLRYCPSTATVPEHVELGFSEPVRLAPDAGFASAFRLTDEVGPRGCAPLPSASSVLTGSATERWAIDCGPHRPIHRVEVALVETESGAPVHEVDGGFSIDVDVSALPVLNGCRQWSRTSL